MADTANDTAEKCVKQAGDNDSSKQGCHTAGFDDANHDRHKRKACTLHNWQPCTNRPKANGLEQGCDTGKQHRHLNQKHHIGATKRKAGSAGNDNRGCHVTRKHRQHMLDTKRRPRTERQIVIRIFELIG